MCVNQCFAMVLQWLRLQTHTYICTAREDELLCTANDFKVIEIAVILALGSNGRIFSFL